MGGRHETKLDVILHSYWLSVPRRVLVGFRAGFRVRVSFKYETKLDVILHIIGSLCRESDPPRHQTEAPRASQKPRESVHKLVESVHKLSP